jgi:hypothetical protein
MEQGEIYKTSDEVFDLLVKQDFRGLPGGEEKVRRRVREVLVKNSQQYFQRKADGTFYLPGRARELNGNWDAAVALAFSTIRRIRPSATVSGSMDVQMLARSLLANALDVLTLKDGDDHP